MPRPRINLAVLVSGAGTTLQNFIDRIRLNQLDARIRLVITSRDGVAAIRRAADAGLPHQVVDRKKSPNASQFSRDVFKLCDKAEVDLVCLGGWLCLLEIPNSYENRVMNIHPALLPSFGGAGMYGRRVHEAVLEQGCKVSGCTVHFVDGTYDTGPIIVQKCCEVLDDDTPDVLAARVSMLEHIAYPQAIKLFQRGALRVESRRVRVIESAPA